VRAVFRRWGLPEIVFGGKAMEQFYVGLLQADGCRDLVTRPARVAGHRAVGRRAS